MNYLSNNISTLRISTYYGHLMLEKTVVLFGSFHSITMFCIVIVVLHYLLFRASGYVAGLF